MGWSHPGGHRGARGDAADGRPAGDAAVAGDVHPGPDGGLRARRRRRDEKALIDVFEARVRKAGGLRPQAAAGAGSAAAGAGRGDAGTVRCRPRRARQAADAVRARANAALLSASACAGRVSGRGARAAEGGAGDVRAPARAAERTSAPSCARDRRAAGAAHRDGAEQLTLHELQIAVLVAQGMTNREAPSALFLSLKTIEYHLGQIYRKLDVQRGRAPSSRG